MYKSVLDYFDETVQRVPQKVAVRHKEDYRKRHKNLAVILSGW